MFQVGLDRVNDPSISHIQGRLYSTNVQVPGITWQGNDPLISHIQGRLQSTNVQVPGITWQGNDPLI